MVEPALLYLISDGGLSEPVPIAIGTGSDRLGLYHQSKSIAMNIHNLNLGVVF